jgi:hypothetical protein
MVSTPPQHYVSPHNIHHRNTTTCVATCQDDPRASIMAAISLPQTVHHYAIGRHDFKGTCPLDTIVKACPYCQPPLAVWAAPTRSCSLYCRGSIPSHATNKSTGGNHTNGPGNTKSGCARQNWTGQGRGPRTRASLMSSDGGRRRGEGVEARHEQHRRHLPCHPKKDDTGPAAVACKKDPMTHGSTDVCL